MSNIAIKLPTPKTGNTVSPTPTPTRVVRRIPKYPARVTEKERHFGVEVGAEQIKDLVELIQYDGLARVAEYMELDPVTVLRVCAGLMHMCRAETQHKIRAFFAK